MSSTKRRAEVIAQIVAHFGSATYSSDIEGPEFSAELEKAAPHLRAAPAPVDIIILQDATQHDLAAIAEGMKPGAAIVGLGWEQKPPALQRAVAAAFHLMDIAVGPETVWLWRKATAP